MKLEPRAGAFDGGTPPVIEPMTDADVKDVLRIEQQSFSTTWPTNAFYQELHENKLAH